MRLNAAKVSNVLLFLITSSVFATSVDVFPHHLLNILEIIFYSAILLFALLNFDIHKSNTQIAKGFSFVFLFYLLFFLGSAIFSPDIIYGLKIFINTGLISFLGVVSASAYLKKRDLSFFIATCFYLSLLIAVISCIVIVFGLDVHYYAKERTLDVTSFGYKFSGLYENQNRFGLLLGVLISFTVFLFTQKTIRIPKTILISSLFLAVALLILAMSRGAILFTIMFVFCYFTLSPQKKQAKWTLAILMISALGAILFIDVTPLFERVSEGSLTGRNIIWADAIQKGSKNIILGMGPNQYRFINDYGYEISAHNFYINKFVDLGLPATLLYIFALTMVLLHGVKSHRRVKDFSTYLGQLLAFSVSFLIALILHQLFESNSLNPTTFAGYTASFLIGFILNFETRFQTLFNALPNRVLD